MSGQSSSTVGPDEDSSGTSPTDTHAQPRRFEPILRSGDDDEEPERAMRGSTARGNRPAAASTEGGATNYGTIDTMGTTEELRSEGHHTPTQDPNRQGRRSTASSIRQRVASPEPKSLAPKPKIARKPSTKHMTPHKGQEFSVDDDPDEYESDVAHRKASGTISATGRGHRLGRKTSTVRRRSAPQPRLPRVDSQEEEEPASTVHTSQVLHRVEGDVLLDDSGEESSGTVQPETGEEDDDDADISDAESFTLKDRQNAINETHPFGIRIWKPALYKKNRSVEKTAEGDIHSTPGGHVSNWLFMFNFLWTILFGWWLAAAAALGALVCFAFAFAPEASDYGRTFWGLARYIFYPFGHFVKLEQDEAYADEDEGEGRSIGEYERWQAGDLEDGRLFFGPLTSRSLVGRRRSSIDSSGETDSLLGRRARTNEAKERKKRRRARLFGRGQWTAGRVIFFIFFYFLIAPLLLLASAICWFLVFSIPMGRVTSLLFYHLRRHPLALSFKSDSTYSRIDSGTSSILLCTYRAVGTRYWKYTVDGTNIFLINLIGVVLFAIFDYWILGVALGLQSWIVHPGLVFALALFSIIPLAYFIGQAVASISAQSTMGVGAAINAFFSTVVEVFLYCVALNQGKGQLVEGSIIGSIFAGILFLPGLSMCFGAINRKTQRFNVRSAGVTSTMLLFATIAAFGPTLFYQIYGGYELNCHKCAFGDPDTHPHNEGCRRCYFAQSPPIMDKFFVDSVRPFCWIAAILLFMSYIIGLWFTLRTHAATIWNTEIEEKKAAQQSFAAATAPNGNSSQPAAHSSLSAKVNFQRESNKDASSRTSSNAIRDTQLYKRILTQSLKQDGLEMRNTEDGRASSSGFSKSGQTPHMVPPKSSDGDTILADTSSVRSIKIVGLSDEQNDLLVRQVAEMAATAAAVAAQNVTRTPSHKASKHDLHHHRRHSVVQNHDLHEAGALPEAAPGGHDAPNWGRLKSSVILLGATILYAVIAEILVNTVDVVLANIDIDEKFLGITLFALVPNTTEFLNAISFAMNGNIALSMEIGSAYALQVCLLQIPALVLFSAILGPYLEPGDLVDHTFNLIFPQFDMVTVILCVFLLSYMYGEGKSNYFKGSILVLTYLVIVTGFYLAGFATADNMLLMPGGTAGDHARTEIIKMPGRGTGPMIVSGR